MIEEKELLPSNRRLLNDLPQAGVILLRVDVNHPRQAGKEAGQTVLHLLGRQLLEAVLQVLVGHQVGGPGHLTHHYRLGLHQIEGALLDNGGLLSQGDAHLERVAGVPVRGGHHGGAGARGEMGGARPGGEMWGARPWRKVGGAAGVRRPETEGNLLNCVMMTDNIPRGVGRSLRRESLHAWI